MINKINDNTQSAKKEASITKCRFQVRTLTVHSDRSTTLAFMVMGAMISPSIAFSGAIPIFLWSGSYSTSITTQFFCPSAHKIAVPCRNLGALI